MNFTFSAGTAEHAHVVRMLGYARNKPEGFVWTDHDEFHTVKSQVINGYHFETEEKHRKDYIEVLLDGLKGTAIEGGRLVVSCGYAELGNLDPK